MESFMEGIKQCVNDPAYAHSESGRNKIIDGVKQIVGPDVNGNDLNRSNINVNVVVPSVKSNDIQSQAQAQVQYQKQVCGSPAPKKILKPVYKEVPIYKKVKEEREVVVQCGTKKVQCGVEEYYVDPCGKVIKDKCCDKKKYVCKNKCVTVCKCKRVKRRKPKCDSTSSYCSSSSSEYCSSVCESSSSSYCSSSTVPCKKKKKYACKNKCVKVCRCKKEEKIVECKPYLHCKEKVRPIYDYETKKKYIIPDCDKDSIKYHNKSDGLYKNDLKYKW